MTCRVLTFFAFLTFLMPFVTASHWSRRHQEVAHRARGDVDLHKRQGSGARFTYYDVGLGACGQTNVPSDFIVALNVAQYGDGYPGPQCFKSITIQYGGKTAVATIMDECMGCPYNGLDFSRGLFSYFADFSEGVLYGTWWYNDGNGGGGGGGGDQSTSTPAPPATTWEPPATTSTPDYTPPSTTSSTPDYTPPPPTSSTSTYTPPPMTSTTSTTSTTPTSSAPSTSLTNFSTGLAVPTEVVSSPGTNNPDNILVINDILVEIGIVLSVAEKNE